MIAANRPRVLFVDDEAPVGRAFARVAERMGYEVDLASTGPGAVRMARSRPYDLVVADISMPGIDGLALVGRLAPALVDTGFVALSAQHDSGSRSALKSHPAISAFIPKPWTPREIQAALEKAQQEARSRSTIRPRTPSHEEHALLLISDGRSEPRSLRALLAGSRWGRRSRTVTRLSDALDLLAHQSFDLIAAFVDLPDSIGLESISRLQRVAWQTPIVFLSRTDDPMMAAEALRAGAQDYIVDSLVSGDELARRLHYAIERAHAMTRTMLEAHHDPLTGLATREVLRRHAQVAMSHADRAATVALLSLDLDGFDGVNERHGHGAGDVVLREIGRRLRRIARAHDTVARMGGDEFTVLLDEVDSAEALAIAERIVELVARPITVDDTTVSVTPSVGIALSTAGTVGVDALIDAADHALFGAKAIGHGRTRIHPVIVSVFREATKR